MAALGTKLRTLQGDQVAFWCPGCGAPHAVAVPPHPGAWEFNGDGDAPTFRPSVLVTWPANPNASEECKEWRTERRCHSYVGFGRIEFLGDSTHALAGQTVDLPDFDPTSPYAT